MVPILSAGIFFLPFFLFIKTMSLYKDSDFFTVIRQLLGKYLGSIICLLLIIINFFAISFDSRTYVNVLSSHYYQTTPTVVIYGVLIFVCAYGAKKGLQHIGSVAWIVIFYVMASFYLALLLSVQDTTIEAIFPIWGTGKAEILKQSSLNITLFVDLYILAILIPYLKSFKEYRRGVWISFIYVIIHLTFAFLIYICLFDTELKEIGYPFHTAIRYLSFGNFLSNIETLFLPIWVMGALIRFAALMYLNAMMFGHLFKVKNFEYLIPSLAIIYLLIGSIPEAQVDVSFVKSYIKVFAGPTYAILAILLWLIALIKGEFKHGNNKNSL